jgi:hypothetical protein
MHLHVLHNAHRKFSLNLKNKYIINKKSVPASLCFFVCRYFINCLALQPFLRSLYLLHFLYFPYKWWCIIPKNVYKPSFTMQLLSHLHQKWKLSSNLWLKTHHKISHTSVQWDPSTRNDRKLTTAFCTLLCEHTWKWSHAPLHNERR